jgi:hypothetical protein
VTLDPLFGDAPASGEVRWGGGQYLRGYQWRRATGERCVACGSLIEGRRFEVKPLGRFFVAVSGAVVPGPVGWWHVGCIPGDVWAQWLPPPRAGKPRRWEKARKGSGRAKAIEASRVAVASAGCDTGS